MLKFAKQRHCEEIPCMPDANRMGDDVANPVVKIDTKIRLIIGNAVV